MTFDIDRASLRADVPLIWVMNPAAKSVHVYDSGTGVRRDISPSVKAKM